VFIPKIREVAKDPRSRAKPQRPIVPSIRPKLSPAKMQERDILTNYNRQLISRIRHLTNQNNILRTNAIK
ncbi:unnamed protein product, partial [Rotaria sp. Silwood2]